MTRVEMVSGRLKKLSLIILTSLSLQLYAADVQQPKQVLHNIKLPDLSGESHSLKDWKGKVILLNFWASWCTPCQYEIPNLISYQKRYGGKKFQVVSIGLDEIRKLKNVKRSLGINYPVLVVSQQQGADLLVKLGDRQQIVPYTIILTKAGEISYTHQGEFDDNAFDLYVKPLL